MHPNDIEFCSYDIAETFDKQYVFVGYPSYAEFGQRIIVFEHHISLHDWIQQLQLVIEHKLNQELISILQHFVINILFTFNVILFYSFVFS